MGKPPAPTYHHEPDSLMNEKPLTYHRDVGTRRENNHDKPKEKHYNYVTNLGFQPWVLNFLCEGSREHNPNNMHQVGYATRGSS